MASVGHSKTLLGRMWFLHVPDSLNSDNMFAVNTCERGDTGIDGRMVEFLRRWVHLGDNLARVRTLTVLKNMEVMDNIQLCKHHSHPLRIPALFPSILFLSNTRVR